MKKIVRLTERDLTRLVKRVISESEGELNNKFWMQIKKTLEGMGFKFESHNEKGEGLSMGGFQQWTYGDRNPFKDYQFGHLTKGNVFVKYPYTEVEGGPVETDKIRVHLDIPYDNGRFQDNTKLVQSLIKKYGNSMIHPKTTDDSDGSEYIMNVKDVNSVVGLVKDLSSLKR
jgi:hypothetical protein